MEMRSEIKFLIDPWHVETLNQTLMALFERDIYSVKSYPVFSAYFDTSNLRCFYEKINGEYLHSKIRIRCYEKNFSRGMSPIFLEAKIKEKEDQKKIRIPLPDNMRFETALNPSNWFFIQDEKILDIFRSMDGNAYYHILNVFYLRDAFEILYQGKRLRLNLDSHISAGPPHVLCSRKMKPIIPDHMCIFEVKYDDLLMPIFVQEFQHRIPMKRIRYSKFTEAMLHLDEQKKIGKHNCFEEVVF